MSRFFIERPILANVLAIVTILIGAVSLANLPVAQYPNIVPPTIQVSTSYPGASAQLVAETVGIPIEQAVNGVEGSIYMSSSSASDGTYKLIITFAVGTDLNTSVALVQNFVNSALSQLPPVVQSIGVNVRKVSTSILLMVSLDSEDDRYDATFLSNYAIIHLKNPLGRIPGMGQVNVLGAGQYSMRIWLDPQKLQNHFLTPQDVIDAIRQQNLQVVSGQLGAPPVPDDQPFQYTITALGRLTEVEQFEQIIVKAETGEAAGLVRVSDLGRVELSQEVYSNFASINGKTATHITTYALPGANALGLAAEIRTVMDDLSRDFPEGLDWAVHYDTTRFINASIDDVYETLFEAGILVLIVIMVFLQNLRAMLVPATTVPVTIIGAFAAMAALGFSVNLMTLFAVILAIGIVVDDAILIVENSSRYVEQGMSGRDAAIKAMSELTGPVLGVTLVLTSVFVPAAFMPGITGQLFRQFALVIAATAIISAINALTLKPAQCALYLKPQGDRPPNRFYQGFNAVYGRVESAYISVVQHMVDRPRMMAGIFAVIIGATVFGFSRLPTGFLPDEDQGYGIIVAHLPDAASQPRVRAAAAEVSGLLEGAPGVDSWATIGGFSILDQANVSNMFTTFVVYKDWSERGPGMTQDVILAGLRRRMATIEDARILVTIPPPIAGLGQSGGFQMMVEDRDSLGPQELDRATHALVGAARGQSGLRRVATTFTARSPQLFLDIDRTQARSQSVAVSDVFDALQAYLGSAFVNLFNKFNQVFKVYVQADAPYRLDAEDIERLHVRNADGDMVPLGGLLDVRRSFGSTLTTRYNLYPAASVYGGAAPGFSSGDALELMEGVAAATLPAGMRYDWTATAYQQKQIGNQAYFIYALSILLVYLVLAGQYESWSKPVAVILVVPMALVGVYLALALRGFDNNLYTQVGLVLMIALASKNAILVVEFATDLEKQGMSLAKAAVEATRLRFRPIVMTSFAFILGVVPLLTADGAGAASQQALGTVVFGGMLASTLLAIPFVPVFYVLSQRAARRGKPAASEHPAATE